MQTYQLTIAIIFISVAALAALGGWYTKRTRVALAAGGLAAVGLVVLTILGVADPAGESDDGGLSGSWDNPIRECKTMGTFGDYRDFFEGSRLQKSHAYKRIQLDRCYPITWGGKYMHRHKNDGANQQYDSTSTKCFEHKTQQECERPSEFKRNHLITCEWKQYCKQDVVSADDKCYDPMPEPSQVRQICARALGLEYTESTKTQIDQLDAYHLDYCKINGKTGHKIQCRQHPGSAWHNAAQ